MHRTRQLSGVDAKSFQALRLEALERHPAAFAAAPEEEAGRSLDEIGRRLDEGTVFGAFVDSRLVGSAGFVRPDRIKKRHKGVLWGLYVQAAVRGRGLGRALVERVIVHARDRVQQLHATVSTFGSKSTVFAAQSSCFGVESGGRIARAPKRLLPARTYAHRTPCRMMLQK
jgi:GNAT superfamily N-acetyltransferase